MHIVQSHIPGLLLRDIHIDVPLSWSDPDGQTIGVFAREVTDITRRNEDLPILLFLQGGPGGKSPRPANGGPLWLTTALKTHRVLLLDQRGTGMSTGIDGATMARFGGDGKAGADYLSFFRADSIVKDCEHFRKTLYGDRKWEILGQSYGGFITLTYLSFAPEALAACYVTGGLSGLNARAEDVYARTYPRLRAKNDAYYERYPQDRALLAKIADRLNNDDIRLPDGDRLTVRRLQTLGLALGMKSGFDDVHFTLEEVFSSSGQTQFSDAFLTHIMTLTGFSCAPLFAVMQESIYGQCDSATRWAAERVRATFPDFAPSMRPLLFTGEMIYPWMFEDIRALRPFRAAAETLAARENWPPLYDLERLKNNEVPVAALIYYDDMYVDADLSLDTAKHLGNCQKWVTNRFEHDGLRQSQDTFSGLIERVRLQGGPQYD